MRRTRTPVAASCACWEPVLLLLVLMLRLYCRPIGESAAGDKALVAAARNGVGSDVSLLVDAACVWPDARTALARAKAFEPYDLFLLEEPLHPDDIDGYIW